MGRVIIINEATQRMLKEEMEMTEYKFKGSVKRFLHDLLQDPVTAEPGNVLTLNGLTRAKLIKLLIKKGILQKHMSIIDKNADGEPMTAKMKVSFKVPKQEYDKKVKRLYIELFEKNVPEKKKVNENVTIFTPNEIDRLIGNNRGDQIEQMEGGQVNIRYKDELDSPMVEIDYDTPNLKENGITRDELVLAKKSPLCMGFITDRRLNKNSLPDQAVDIYNKELEKKKKDVDECCAGGAAGGCACGGDGACSGGGEGTGATGCSNDGAGQFMTSAFPMQRRTIYGTEPKKKKKKKNVDETTTTTNSGQYQYDVPLLVDKDDPTMKRHQGVNGSESINIA